MRASLCIRLGALFAGLAVGLGAIAAHGMKEHFAAGEMQTFETGVRYQMYHGLALLACGALAAAGVRVNVAAWSFAAGTVCFSGSLYGLVLGGPRWLGPVTPIGGVLFLVGWLALVIAAGRRTTATDADRT